MFCRDAHDGANDMIVHDEAPKHFFLSDKHRESIQNILWIWGF